MTIRDVWVVDDDASIRWVLDKALSKAGYRVRAFESAAGVVEAMAEQSPHAIISDIRMPGEDGLALLSRIQTEKPEVPVIIMTAHSDLDSAVSAFDGGAFEYLPKPFDVDEALEQVQRAIRTGEERQSQSEGDESSANTEIIGSAPAMQEVFRAIGRLARSNITVMINGESGTGKELVARALHRHSPRADAAFIALNMAAIPEDLVESELFGHERGAFTGAQAKRVGRFEQADGGTLFLDEIGDMPAETQTRLLRVLADGEFYRVGGHTPIKVDVRIIAATHQNLESMVDLGRFREDLFHRLNVIRINIPALRERRQDVPVLMKHFLKSAAAELEEETKNLLPETAAYLSELDWPGNVRQLENMARWLTVMASGKDIHIEDLPRDVRDSDAEPSSTNGSDWPSALRAKVRQQLADGDQDILGETIPVMERILIEEALAKTGGRRQDAAHLLGWGRNTLTRKIKELEMHAD